MKERILELLNGMTVDSKSTSYKYERELCKILTSVIDKKNKIESYADYSHNFPCLYDAYFRFSCIDFNTGYEFHQPYYVTHQDEFFNGLKSN